MESLSTFSQNIPVENSSKIGNPKSHVSVPRKRSENGEGSEAFTLNRDGENKLGGLSVSKDLQKQKFDKSLENTWGIW